MKADSEMVVEESLRLGLDASHPYLPYKSPVSDGINHQKSVDKSNACIIAV